MKVNLRAVRLVAVLLALTAAPASSTEILRHHIPSRELRGDVERSQWAALARNRSSGRIHRLDAWNPRLARWEPSVWSLRSNEPSPLWISGDVHMPLVGYEVIRRFTLDDSEKRELRISGTARLLQPQGPLDDGVELSILRESTPGSFELLWGGPLDGVLTPDRYASHDILLSANPGDRFLFAVSARSAPGNDLTSWIVDIAVSRAPETEDLASSSFWTRRPQPPGNAWDFLAWDPVERMRAPLVEGAPGAWILPPSFGEPFLGVFGNSQHPGSRWACVRRWTHLGSSPREIVVRGNPFLRFQGQPGQDGVTLAILHASPRLGLRTPIWRRKLDDRLGTPEPLASEHELALTVIPGDQIWFIVSSGEAADAAFDLVLWNPEIRVHHPVSVSDARTGLGLSVGRRQTVMTPVERLGKGLPFWPDGNIGCVRETDGTTSFYGPNGSQVAWTRGSLASPAREVLDASISIRGIPPGIDYAAGGPVFVVPKTDPPVALLFYHAEELPGGDPTRYYSRLGMAIRADDGGFDDLGFILEPEYQGREIAAVMLFGAHIVHTDPKNGETSFIVYTKDTRADGSSVNLTAARARYDDVIEAARLGTTVPWLKYHDDGVGKPGFTQPGLGHHPSTSILPDLPIVQQVSVVHSSAIDRYVMAVSVHDDDYLANGNVNIWLYTSEDGLGWIPLSRIEDDAFESFYCSLLTSDGGPASGSLFVYYTRSMVGGVNGFRRWEDARLVRRELRFLGGAPGTIEAGGSR
jgi:hypothetical protein